MKAIFHGIAAIALAASAGAALAHGKVVCPVHPKS